MSKITKPILITGHARCGTGYMSELCKALGVQVGHEKMLEDGISSWLFAVEGEQPWIQAIKREDYEFERLIHVIRDPIKAVSSIAYTENTNKDSLQYRLPHLDLPGKLNAIDLAVRSYLQWNALIQAQEPDLIVKVEEANAVLPEFLESIGYPIPEDFDDPPHDTNKRAHPELTPMQLETIVPKDQFGKLMLFAKRWGYAK